MGEEGIGEEGVRAGAEGLSGGLLQVQVRVRPCDFAGARLVMRSLGVGL